MVKYEQRDREREINNIIIYINALRKSLMNRRI